MRNVGIIIKYFIKYLQMVKYDVFYRSSLLHLQLYLMYRCLHFPPRQILKQTKHTGYCFVFMTWKPVFVYTNDSTTTFNIRNSPSVRKYDDDFQANAEKLIGYYLKRGYPEKALRKHYKRAARYTQDDLLEIKHKTQVNTPVMVTNFNTCNPNIKDIIHRNWNIISNSADCGNLFNSKPIVGFRRLPNLRDTHKCHTQIPT